MLIAPGTPSAGSSGGQHTTRLKAVVRDELRLDPDTAVVLSELRCGEDTCAPLETVVAVLDGSDRTWKLPNPRAEVSPHELRALIAEHPEGAHA